MRISDWSSDVCSSDLADRILDQRALLRLVHAVAIARVVDAMAEKFPAARIGVLDHLRKMLAHRDRQADRSRKTMLAHRLRHAPVADAIAIVAVAISDDVRVRPCPALAVRVGGRV